MYILKCSDNSYYVGSTTNLTLRVEEHKHGKGAEYTKHRLPVELVYYEECKNIKDAFLREKQVQGWSRKKREALINNQHSLLPSLSKSKNVVSTSSTTAKETDVVVESVETTTKKNMLVEPVETTTKKKRVG